MRNRKKPSRRPPPAFEEDPVFFRLFPDQAKKGERRKLEIVRATIEVLASHGIHRTTYEAVAQKLGIGRSQVAYHFSTMQELFELTLRYVIDTIQSGTIGHVQAAKTAHERVLAVFTAIYHWAREQPARAKVLTLLYHLSGHDPLARKLHADIRRAGQRRLGQLMIEAEPRLAKKPEQLAAACRVLQAVALGSVLGFGALEDESDVLPSLEEIHAQVRLTMAVL